MRMQNLMRRPAAITVLMAVAMIPVIGITAIVLEGGLVQDQRRRIQATADAAALAAAADLYKNFPASAGADNGGSAKASALLTSAANGYAHDSNTKTTNVTVNIPPLSGPFITKLGYAEVIIDYKLTRSFGKIFGSQSLPITARAVARGTWKSENVGVLVLDPSSKGSLTASGSGTVTISQASINVNSNHPEATTSTGGGSLTCPDFEFTGNPGYSISGGGSINGPINSNVSPSADPLAYLPEPDPSSMTLQSDKKLQLSGNKTYNLDPGRYIGGIAITAGAKVNMQPGIYYMDGGGFNYTGSGWLAAQGVMIYNTGAGVDDAIKIAGQGAINMTPMTSGPYAGISLFQTRSSTTPISVNGQGQVAITGTFYAASAQLDISSGAGDNVMGSQYISWNLKLSGNGNITIDWASGASKTRHVGLVE